MRAEEEMRKIIYDSNTDIMDINYFLVVDRKSEEAKEIDRMLDDYMNRILEDLRNNEDDHSDIFAFSMEEEKEREGRNKENPFIPSI